MARALTERDYAAAADADTMRALLDLLAAIRSGIDALGLPNGESAAELRQGLDIAWIGTRRLLAETDLAASSDQENRLEDDRTAVQ